MVQLLWKRKPNAIFLTKVLTQIVKHLGNGEAGGRESIHKVCESVEFSILFFFCFFLKLVKYACEYRT